MPGHDLFSGRPLAHLTQSEAKAVLERFLQLGREGMAVCASLAASEGWMFDFSRRSLVCLFAAVGKKIRFMHRPLPNDLPGWIRDVPQHSKGIVEFDQESRVWMMRVAFHLGEFFVRAHPQLRWGVGDANFANHNFPVVTGFKGHQELPPLTVTEGMYIRVLSQDKSWEQVETMIESWQSSVQ